MSSGAPSATATPTSSQELAPSLLPTPSDTPRSSLPGLKRGIGIGVGVCFFLILVLLVAFLAIRHRRKARKRAKEADPESGSDSRPSYPIDEKSKANAHLSTFVVAETDSSPLHEMPGYRMEDTGAGELMSRERQYSELSGDLGKEQDVGERIHELDATEPEIRRDEIETVNNEAPENGNSARGDTEWKEIYLNFGR